MGKCSRHGPKVALILILLFCFGLQVWDGLVKYFGRQTTLVSTTEQLKSARLPTISFCPGMKGGKLFYDFVEELKGTFNSTEQMNGSLIGVALLHTVWFANLIMSSLTIRNKTQWLAGMKTPTISVTSFPFSRAQP